MGFLDTLGSDWRPDVIDDWLLCVARLGVGCWLHEDRLPVGFHLVGVWLLGVLDTIRDAGDAAGFILLPVSLYCDVLPSFGLFLEAGDADGWCLGALLPNDLAHSKSQRYSERLEYRLLIIGVDGHVYDGVQPRPLVAFRVQGPKAL